MKLDGRSIFKGIVKFVGSMGVGTLVTLGVKQNIIPGNKYEKIMCAIGSFVLSDMISSQADKYLEGQVDEGFKLVDSLKGEPVKEVPHVDTDFLDSTIKGHCQKIQDKIDVLNDEITKKIKFDENGLPIEETLIMEEED